MKILIIDPDKMMREVLVRSLASAAGPFSPLEASDVESGFSAAAVEKPDFVFLDFDAVADDPAAAVSRIKEASDRTKIVIVSGMGVDEDALASGVSAGASSISKPFRMDSLRAIFGASSEAALPARQTESAAARRRNDKAASPGKKIKIALAIVVVSAIVSAAVFLKTFDLSRALPSATFMSGAPNISYLSFYDGKIYVTDWMDQSVYGYLVPRTAGEKTLIAAGVFKKKELQPAAAAVSEGALWMVDSLQGMIFKYSVGKDMTVTPAGSYKAPATAPAGILVEPAAVWTYDVHTKKLYKHRLEDMAVLASYDLPVETPCGIARLGEVFYVADSRTGRVVGLRTDDMTIAGVGNFAAYTSGNEKIVGLCSDGKNLWSASEGGKIYRHGPSELSSGIK